MNILSVHAHPDDAEILAGGTLALLAAAGHAITIATMTAGDCGSAEHGALEIAGIRLKESEGAAALIGARHVCAGFDDLAIFSDDGSRRRVTELLRRLRPDIVLTSSPTDYHCDHEATSQLVRDACFGVSAPNYRTGTNPPLDAIPHLYFMDSVEGVDRDGRPVQPDFAVNVGAYFETKRDMLAAHASQRNWLLKQHGIDDYLKTMEEWTRTRGDAYSVEFAEGFRQYRVHPYPKSPLLQQLIGSALLR